MSETLARKVALVGAAGQVGKEVKQQLARAGVPGERIELLDLEEHVGLVTEYGEEARVVQEAAEEPVRKARLACFCGDGETARRLAPVVVEAGGVAIDCTGALAGDERAVPTGSGGLGPRLAVTPHPGAILLRTLAEGLDMDAIAATLLLPASERGERAPDSMARESAQLLNVGLRELGEAEERRYAFDLWVGEDARERILHDLALADVKPPRLAVVRAPVFHGLSASLFVHGLDSEAVRTALTATPVVLDDARDSPARVAGSPGVHVTGIRTDGGGAWLWAVADNYAATASAAVAEIVSLLEPDDEPVI